MNSARDWGSAADYVKAMRAMLNQPAPRDMVIASGKLTSVRDFFRIAAIAAGFDPLFDGDGVTEECIDRNTGLKLFQVSDKYFRPFDTSPIYGDPSMIERETGWRRSIDLESMITDMVQQDINRWHQESPMFENLKSQLEGCFYTIFTPFLEDEAIDYESLERYFMLCMNKVRDVFTLWRITRVTHS